MNIFRKLWCRTFQAAFRAALPLLPYSEPKLLSGVDEAAALFAEKHIGKVLIVTDASLEKLGLVRPLTDALARRQIRWSLYSGVVPNPTIDNVETARLQYTSEGCGAVIGLGGGSCMDCAKIVAARVGRPNLPIPKMRGILRILHRLPLIVAIPTTAGTGSETTVTAVITDPQTHEKYPISDFCLTPKYAVMAPELTLGLPRHITATTGLDALTHAVEAYIGGTTNRYTRSMAEEAVRLVREYLPRACADGRDTEARAHMLRAAFCAGNAFSRSYVGYVHGLAHALGGRYGVPHGLANAVILPHFLEFYGAAIHTKLGQLARNTGIAPASAADSEAARLFINWVWQINKALDIPLYIDQIREDDIPAMARHADRECNPLYPVPVLMDAPALETMFRQVGGMNRTA